MRVEHPPHQFLPERAFDFEAPLFAQRFHAAHGLPFLMEFPVELVGGAGEPEIAGVRGVHVADRGVRRQQRPPDIKKYGFKTAQHLNAGGR